MFTCVLYFTDNGKLPEESKDTANLLIFFDNLFDSVNGSSSKIEGGKEYRSAVTPNSPHHKLWEECIPVLKSMKFETSSGKFTVVPSLSSWVKTIEAFKAIITYLNSQKIYSVLLRHFNQDPIENFFGAIRSQGCQNVMPNAAQFQSAYKTLVVNNMTSSHSVGANCENDKSPCLLDNLQNFFKNKSEHSQNSNEVTVSETHLLINPVETENLIKSQSPTDVERCAALGYCSGWLVKKAKKIFKRCPHCKICLESEKMESFHKFIKVSEYSEKAWLTYPTKEAFDFFVQIENISKQVFTTSPTKKYICEYIKLVCAINMDTSFIKCSIHRDEVTKFLVHKSITFNLFMLCKTVNKILAGKELNWDHNDRIQKAAIHYYEKNKNKKKL